MGKNEKITGVGRPKLSDNEQTVMDGFKCPKSLRDRFNQRLAELQLNKSETLRDMIEAWLEQHKPKKTRLTF